MFKYIYYNTLSAMFMRAFTHNDRNISELISLSADDLFLDIGCNDGTQTRKLLTRCLSKVGVFGVDIVHHQLVTSLQNELQSVQADAASALPFAADTFDLIHSNQVIEHVADVDLFMSELFRVTKPGGHVIVSTENASSWVNIISLFFGYQMFSLTNMSIKRGGIGNPLALHRNTKDQRSSWTHKTIFSIRGLQEFSEAHGFSVLFSKGAGYFPLPTTTAIVDPMHAHFITFLLRKPS